MSIRALPAARVGAPAAGLRFDLSARAMERWNPAVQAATEQDNTISILDIIGQDFWSGEGVTAKRIAGALRVIGENDVVVNINSPGGDMFEGLAIYNLLREHPGNVTIKVLGMAASAASIIAMAGDEVQVARAGFLMIHNAWTWAAGNRHDFREFAEYLEPFDAAMADVYVARTGLDAKTVATMMDGETWIGGSKAVEHGFADSLLDSDEVAAGNEKPTAKAVRRVENALRASGMPRSEAMRLISEFKASLSDSAGRGERDATDPGRKATRLQVEPLPRLAYPTRS
ncbi:head maturation protease, ClpP-related [Pseudomonas aeruginosa]|uniref:head maturation protease, ClpP-related n=1 Tax=Pseudomonas aeruginosa TaxID=287 RepID=UPI000D394A49|nr:head maturation protease, ClpP-related [Pseudomonas aeruginosa]MBI8101015.1 Clp protease ClpP [Pseudomonas aeruginosa]MCS7761829.1 Clp protease ClpP [Pseudomonas aeruginosa]PTZ59808.1 peptidase [Pseudomonas aeruginosa]HCF0865070.1 Clp protease ClpP [Pseudomonas aeruginosa]HCF3676723.1 Clp protease ClpP [Pseudomonas aeruginosa]